jgi:hypothetical protein
MMVLLTKFIAGIELLQEDPVFQNSELRKDRMKIHAYYFDIW